MFHLIWSRVFSVVDLVTMPRARLDVVFLQALVRRFGDLVGCYRLLFDRPARLGNINAAQRCLAIEYKSRRRNGRR